MPDTINCRLTGRFLRLDTQTLGFVNVAYHYRGKKGICSIPTKGPIDELSLDLAAAEYYKDSAMTETPDFGQAIVDAVNGEWESIREEIVPIIHPGATRNRVTHSSFPRTKSYRGFTEYHLKYGIGGKAKIDLQRGCIVDDGEPSMLVPEESAGSEYIKLQVSSHALRLDTGLAGYFRIAQLVRVPTPFSGLRLAVPFYSDSKRVWLIDYGSHLPDDAAIMNMPDELSRVWKRYEANDRLHACIAALENSLNNDWNLYMSHLRELNISQHIRSAAPDWFRNMAESHNTLWSGSIGEPRDFELRKGRVARDSVEILLPQS